VNRIALQLHVGDLGAHRKFLGRFGRQLGAEWNYTRATLHDYLWHHSSGYRSLCCTEDATAQFWRDAVRPGPAPVLSPPRHWLWDLVVC
jgi:hypothetical protein